MTDGRTEEAKKREETGRLFASLLTFLIFFPHLTAKEGYPSSVPVVYRSVRFMSVSPSVPSVFPVIHLRNGAEGVVNGG